MASLRLNRLRLVLVGLVALVQAAVIFSWLRLPRPRITRENYERIREGCCR